MCVLKTCVCRKSVRVWGAGGAGEFIRDSCGAKMAALTDCLSRCFSNYGPRNNTKKLQAGLVTPCKSDMTWPQN